MLFLVVQNTESNFRRVAVTRTVTVGRRSDCQLRIANDKVSRQHCQIVVDGDVVRIRDLGSANKTYVNGRPLIPGLPQDLNEGDEIVLGSVRLKVDRHGKVGKSSKPEASAAAPAVTAAAAVATAAVADAAEETPEDDDAATMLMDLSGDAEGSDDITSQTDSADDLTPEPDATLPEFDLVEEPAADETPAFDAAATMPMETEIGAMPTDEEFGSGILAGDGGEATTAPEFDAVGGGSADEIAVVAGDDDADVEGLSSIDLSDSDLDAVDFTDDGSSDEAVPVLEDGGEPSDPKSGGLSAVELSETADGSQDGAASDELIPVLEDEEPADEEVAGLSSIELSDSDLEEVDLTADAAESDEAIPVLDADDSAEEIVVAADDEPGDADGELVAVAVADDSGEIDLEEVDLDEIDLSDVDLDDADLAPDAEDAPGLASGVAAAGAAAAASLAAGTLPLEDEADADEVVDFEAIEAEAGHAEADEAEAAVASAETDELSAFATAEADETGDGDSEVLVVAAEDSDEAIPVAEDSAGEIVFVEPSEKSGDEEADDLDDESILDFLNDD